MRRVLAAVALAGLSSCTMQNAGPVSPALVVFFADNSSALEPTGDAIIAQAAARAKAAPDSRVVVRGWTDSDGSPRADVLLSQQRAQRVADALVADGVQPSRIVRQGRGQTHNDPGVESRRVEIKIGG